MIYIKLSFIGNFDPSKELDLFDEFDSAIDIKYQQRNNRKGVTIIEGLIEYITSKDIKELLKKWRKIYGANGHIKDNVIILQGSHNDKLIKYMDEKGICKKENIKLHGF